MGISPKVFTEVSLQYWWHLNRRWQIQSVSPFILHQHLKWVGDRRWDETDYNPVRFQIISPENSFHSFAVSSIFYRGKKKIHLTFSQKKKKKKHLCKIPKYRLLHYLQISPKRMQRLVLRVHGVAGEMQCSVQSGGINNYSTQRKPWKIKTQLGRR